MRVLLDADVPVQLIEPLRHLSPAHAIDHATQRRLGRYKDRPLFTAAQQAGYQAFVTADVNQLNDPAEIKRIASVGFHHIRYSQRNDGLHGLALALAALLAELPRLLDELAGLDGQRLCRVPGLDPTTRTATIIDPWNRDDAPRYWPRRRPRLA